MSGKVSKPIVTDGLVLHLDAANTKSYPGTGTTWTDLTGNGNDGTLTNGPTFDSGSNGSIVFDGVNDYVLLSKPLIFQVGSCLSVWFSSSVTVGGTRYVRLLDNTAGSGWFEFEWNNRILSRDVNNNTFFFCTSINPALALDTSMNNLTLCIETNSVMSIYINGQKCTYSSGTSVTTELTFNSIMRSRAFYNPSADLVNIKFYNRVLSEQEVLQNYNATKDRFGL